MGEGRKIPEVRFEGFVEPWVTRRFFDTVERIIDFRGRTPKKLGMNWSESGYLALSALNVKNGYIDFTADANFGDEELYQKWMSGNELRKGQILFTTEAPMGNVAQIPDNKKYILSQRTIAFDLKGDIITEDFMATLLRTTGVFNALTTLSSGGTAKGVSQKSMEQLDIVVSVDTQEQTVIGNFFRTLDDTIILKKQQHEKTVNIKKAMLEKMFPKNGADVPEIRFEGFNEPWENKQLSSISDTTYGGGTPSTSKEDFWNGNIPWIQSADVRENSVMSVCIRKKITTKGLENSAVKLIPANSIAIVTRVGVGKLCAIPFEYTTSQDIHSLSRIKIDVKYAVYAIYTKFQSELNASQGTSIKGVTKDELLKISIYVPVSSKEQTAIGNFFRNLDTLIEAQQQELDKLQNIKKAFLQKMFV